jgi:hypothetical protein
LHQRASYGARDADEWGIKYIGTALFGGR